MLERVLRRAPFAASIAAIVPPSSASVASGKKGGKKDVKKGRSRSDSRKHTEGVPEGPNPLSYEATALLLTESEVVNAKKKSKSEETLGPISISASSVVGFHGRLGESSWTTIPKQVHSTGGASALGTPTTVDHPTLLVGLSRSAKQQALLGRSGGGTTNGPSSSVGGFGASGIALNAVTVSEYRQAVTQAVRGAMAHGNIETLRLDLPNTLVTVTSNADVFHPPYVFTPAEVAEKTACFAVTGAYRYQRMKSGADAGSNLPVTTTTTGAGQGKPNPNKAAAAKKKKGAEGSSSSSGQGKLKQVLIDTSLQEDVESGCVIGRAVNDARNLGNLREDEGTPEFYVQWAMDQIKKKRNGITVKKVLAGNAIQEAGLELLYNVGRGSIHTPYVLVLEYIGNKKKPDATALVGKGVTFDCGGLNVKPYGSMETMHTDMMGAATVLTAMNAAADLQLPINLVAAVGLVENAIGPKSYHPGCILKSLNGLTVEVRNTDAEGRLVMADLFSYLFPGGGNQSATKASSQKGKHALRLSKKPTSLIDLATLTGAIMISLGTTRAGCFSNDMGLSDALMEAGTWCGEEVWPMPIGPEHLQKVQGQIADLVNTPPGRDGGSCTAAAFLSHFVPSGIKWAHLDIAGPSDAGDKGIGVHPPGATGFGVQLLLDYLRRGNQLRNPN